MDLIKIKLIEKVEAEAHCACNQIRQLRTLQVLCSAFMWKRRSQKRLRGSGCQGVLSSHAQVQNHSPGPARTYYLGTGAFKGPLKDLPFGYLGG